MSRCQFYGRPPTFGAAEGLIRKLRVSDSDSELVEQQSLAVSSKNHIKVQAQSKATNSRLTSKAGRPGLPRLRPAAPGPAAGLRAGHWPRGLRLQVALAASLRPGLPLSQSPVLVGGPAATVIPSESGSRTRRRGAPASRWTAPAERQASQRQQQP